jgi:hypothetical protein
MRELKRPPVVCPHCQACLRWPFSFGSTLDGHDTVEMGGVDPPPAQVPCPRCGTSVDTSGAYAYIPNFPPSFESLTAAYAGYRSLWEQHRQSFEEAAHEVIVDSSRGLASLEADLNTPDGRAWFRQRMFYRSSIAFHRSFQLFLAFLVLDRRYFKTWAAVSGYYSRFYFIQALLNLIQSTWLERDRVAIVFDGRRVSCMAQKDLQHSSKRFSTRGSHEIWWALMEALKRPLDYPVDEMGFVLSRFAFNPQQRNNDNYSFEYLFGGFNELEWSDSGAKQMISHFAPVRRSDQDFTNVDRYFEHSDPDNIDPGDFYGDTDVQSLWCSIVAYLRILRALGFEQSFVRTETLVALSEMHLADDYERVRAGITQSISNILEDNYDASVVDELRNFWRSQ